MAWLYLAFLSAGSFMVWHGWAALKSGKGVQTSGGGAVYLTGTGAAQYSMGQMCVGAVLGLISIVGLLALLYKKDP